MQSQRGLHLLLHGLLKVVVAILFVLVAGLVSRPWAADLRWDDATPEHEEARRLAREEAWTEYLRAHAHASAAYRNGDRRVLDAAIADLQRALALWPAFPEALNELGTAHSVRGQYAEAIDAFRRAIELRPGWAMARYNAADAYRSNRQWDLALAEYRAILERPGDYAGSLYRVHAGMGHVYENAGRLDEAVTAFRQALISKPDYYPGRIALGNVYFQQRRLESAIAEYEEAVALEPDNAELDYFIGQLHALRRADDLAITWVASALRKGWTNRDAIRYNPLFRRLRTDPRFVALVGG